MKTNWSSFFAVILSLVFIGPVRAEDQAFAREFLDKTIQAVGGQEKLAKLNALTLKSKGKILVNDAIEISVTETWSVKSTDRYRNDMTLEVNGQSFGGTLVINGGKAWNKDNDGKTNELPKDIAAAMKEAYGAARVVQLLLPLKDKSFELSSLGELKIGDRDAVGIRAARKDHRDLSLFFDKKTSLPIKSEVRIAEMQGGQELTYEFIFDEFKEFDGLKLFTKLTLKRDGKQVYEAVLSEIKPQELDDSLFDKP